MQEILLSTVDFGSNKISASLGKGIEEEFDIIGTTCVSSRGIKKGLIENEELCQEAFKEVVEKLAKKTAEDIKKIYVGISCNNLRITEGTGSITLNYGKIRGKDIKKAIGRAKSQVNLLDGEEIVYATINYYTVDEKIVYDDNIVGWLGETLGVNVSIIIGKSEELQKFKNIIINSGYEFKGFVVNPLACRNIFLQGRNSMGVKVLVDIGSQTSDIAIFRNGVLKYIDCVPLGGENITRDLSICAELGMSEAENVKKILSTNYYSLSANEEDDDIMNVGTSSISKSLFYEVVKARLEEILSYVNKTIKNTSFCEGRCSIIIYGSGVTYYENISELVKDNINYKVTIADNSYLQMKDSSNLSSLALLKEVFDRIFLINTEVSEVHAKDIIDQKEECIDEIDFEEENSGVISKIKQIIHKLF